MKDKWQKVVYQWIRVVGICVFIIPFRKFYLIIDSLLSIEAGAFKNFKQVGWKEIWRSSGEVIHLTDGTQRQKVTFSRIKKQTRWGEVGRGPVFRDIFLTQQTTTWPVAGGAMKGPELTWVSAPLWAHSESVPAPDAPWCALLGGHGSPPSPPEAWRRAGTEGRGKWGGESSRQQSSSLPPCLKNLWLASFLYTFLSFLVLMSTSCCNELYVSLSSKVSSSLLSICCWISLSRRFWATSQNSSACLETRSESPTRS